MNFIVNGLMFVFTWIRSALPWIAGFFSASISNVLIGAGFSITVFAGFNKATSYLIGIATNAFSGLPSHVIQLMGYMWVDTALNLMISTGVFLLTIKGVREGVSARQGWWKPGQKTGGIDA